MACIDSRGLRMHVTNGLRLRVVSESPIDVIIVVIVTSMEWPIPVPATSVTIAPLKVLGQVEPHTESGTSHVAGGVFEGGGGSEVIVCYLRGGLFASKGPCYE